MKKDTLQVDPRASRDLEGDFATFETENGDANEGVRGAVKNGNLADNGTEVGQVRGVLSLAITEEFDPFRNIPSMSCEAKVSDSGRIHDWKVANTIHGPIVLELR
jgi:hypothetical protein